MKKTICLIGLVFAMLAGGSFMQAMAISSSNDAAEDVKTITIELPFIPWETPPITLADKPSRTGVFTISRDGAQPLIAREIKLVGSIADVPLSPGKTTVVTDGTLIYALTDRVTVTKDTTYASREADVYDLNQPLIWYGTIRMYGTGVCDDSFVGVTNYGSYVMTKPIHSTLSVISTAIGTNNIKAVITKSVFAITLDSGAAHMNLMSLAITQKK